MGRHDASRSGDVRVEAGIQPRRAGADDPGMPLLHPVSAPTIPLALAAVAAAALFVLPLALLALWTARACRGGEGAWFGFVLRSHLFLTLVMFAEAPALLSLHLERAFLAGSATGVIAAWWPALVSTTLHMVALTWAVRVVTRRLRGVTGEANSVRAAVRALAARLLPVLGLLGALWALQRMEWRLAGASALTGIALRLWLDLRHSRVLGMSLEAVTAGELRERVFALAAHAGVKVEQLFVIGARDARLVNAFAMQGRCVLLTDTLLEQLSRREVEAVVAHELAHLKLRHSLLLSATLVVSATVALLALYPLGAWGFALGGLISWQAYALVARACEWAADREAVRWTHDAGALIRALGAISRSNGFPLDWGPWTGLVFAHPSTRGRALALARHGGLAATEAERLLTSEDTDPERWTWTTATVNPEASLEPVAGTTARARSANALGWTSFAACALAAAVVVQLARVFPAALPGATVTLSGAVLGAVVMLVLFDQRATAAYAPWRDALARRLALPNAAHYSGFAPGDTPRLYEGYSDWDVGFVYADAHGLSFTGERAAFTVRRERIVGITSVPGMRSWFPTHRVAVRWQRDDGSVAVFTLRDADVRRMREMKYAAARFASTLEQALATPATDTTRPAGLPPEPAQVTSQDPRHVAGWRTLPVVVIPAALLACAVALLLGLPFAPWRGPGAWEVFIATFGAMLIVRLPYLLPAARTPRRDQPATDALDRAA